MVISKNIFKRTGTAAAATALALSAVAPVALRSEEGTNSVSQTQPNGYRDLAVQSGVFLRDNTQCIEVVVKAVPHNVTVAGVPAKIVGEAGCAEPSRTMDQMINAIGL